MRICENGKYRDMTKEEIENLEKDVPTIPFNERVVSRIRAIYSIDDELAILRQRDTKPLEFAEYNRIVEAIKEEERMV